MNNVRIIETLGWHPGEGVRRGDLHLARMGRTALRLGYDWDMSEAQAKLDRLEAPKPLRIRLTLGSGMDLRLEQSELAPVEAPWRIVISPMQLDADDPWLRLKTTKRVTYDDARANLSHGVNEVIFQNKNKEICEGTITNIFADLGDGLITPPVRCGLLPGILREDLLRQGEAQEGVLTERDLQNANAIYVGNSLRGLIPAKLV